MHRGKVEERVKVQMYEMEGRTKAEEREIEREIERDWWKRERERGGSEIVQVN